MAATEGPRDLLALCAKGEVEAVEHELQNGVDPTQYDEASGSSTLMLAAASGNVRLCTLLLQHGVPWNSLDRKGRCAGEYALDAGHQAVVDAIVDHAVCCELLLGAAGRNRRMAPLRAAAHGSAPSSAPDPGSGDQALGAAPASAEYLSRTVAFSPDKLLDEHNDAVMMRWEAPLMREHARLLCGDGRDRHVLNIGFGMGIVDAEIERFGCASHTIVEAHAGVIAKANADGWGDKAGVHLLHGRWQDLLQEGGSAAAWGPFDAVFYDAYAEDYEDMRHLHTMLPRLLRPCGVYSFFNGLCPDNVFFQGVACQLVQVRSAVPRPACSIGLTA